MMAAARSGGRRLSFFLWLVMTLSRCWVVKANNFIFNQKGSHF